MSTSISTTPRERKLGFRVLFLCASNYITGADINVDGGRLADGSMGSHAG